MEYFLKYFLLNSIVLGKTILVAYKWRPNKHSRQPLACAKTSARILCDLPNLVDYVEERIYSHMTSFLYFYRFSTHRAVGLLQLIFYCRCLSLTLTDLHTTFRIEHNPNG